MRLKILFLLTLCSLNFAIAQNDKQAIRTTLLDNYFELLADQKISEALDYVHPELVDMLGKEMFVNQYKQMFSSPGVEMSMENFTVDTVSATHVYNEIKYALVDYGFKMTFKVDISDDESGLLPGILLSSYQSRFGKENVSSEIPGTYLINVVREMFAVQSSTFEGWKILDFEEGMRIFLVNIIPEEVLKHFKK